jgi:MFS family permease
MSTRHRVLRVSLIFLLVVSVGEGVMSTLFAPFVRSVLHGTSDDYGFIVSVQAVGGIAGGLVAASIGDRLRASRMLGWGALAFGLIDLVMFLYPLAWLAVWPAAACMIVVGLPGALTLAGAMTLVVRYTGDSHRGRVFGALGVVEGIAVVAGTVAAGFLGQSIGIIPVLATQGCGYVAAGLFVLVALRPGADGKELASPGTLLSARSADRSMSTPSTGHRLEPAAQLRLGPQANAADQDAALLQQLPHGCAHGRRSIVDHDG